MKKYRNPQTGEVFESIDYAWLAWSCGKGVTCGTGSEQQRRCPFAKTICRGDWCHAHPTEAARLMGYEVVDEKEEPAMDENKKPLAEWTLGEMKDYCHENVGKGACWTNCPFGTVCGQLDTSDKYVPGDWDLTDKPRWTEAEVMLAKGFVAFYPVGEIERSDDDTLGFRSAPGWWGGLPQDLFPSAPVGRAIRLADIAEAGQC